MASRRALRGRTTTSLSSWLLFYQHWSPTGSGSGSSNSSSSSRPCHRSGRCLSRMAWKETVLCVFVMCMVLSACDLNLMKMSALASAADSSDGSSGSSSGSDGSKNGDSSSDSSDSSSSSSSSANPQCVLKGRVYTERLWYGYLFDKAFHRDYAKIQYTISYPVKQCCTSLLIYYDDQIKQLKQDMTCEERERVLPPNNNQVIPLHTLNKTAGCRVWNDTDESYYVCIGERIFRSSGPRTWYFALSRCQAKNPLTVNYAFNISGYYGDCEEDPLVRTYIPPSPKEDSNYLSLALGIVAGVAIIAAVVFFVLWFIARRNAANSKGSSVTSSQATMTQDDIFYVNPSLSDREQAEYGTSQASSENYYEVIPERRSYESINPHLLGVGGAGVGPGGPHHHPLVHGPPHLTHHLHPIHAHHHGAHPAHPRHHLLHPANAAAAAAAANQAGGMGNQLKESAFHRPGQGGGLGGGGGVGGGYPVFDDYPPPPYQPPRLLGGPRHHTLHHPTPHHHHHSLSMPPTAASRPRPPLLSPTHAATLSFPGAGGGGVVGVVGGGAVLPPAPAPTSSTAGLVSASATPLNNNTASGNNNNGNNSNNNITSTSAITMNTTTNTVSLGETAA
ncbi:uncharacterized protein LOC143277984 [Babylonia areolata]|uniref:uncharacterized protein LOC143277984 n=1 Tax=Babylonia areolata TaxID=304850 RepID=UPI003FD534B5